MYYVMFVGTGQEDKTRLLISQLIPSTLYEECFYPNRIMKKKIKGSWITIRERLTPGYLFIRTDHILNFYQYLRNIPSLTQLLGIDKEINDKSLPGDHLFYDLPPEEEEWLVKMTRLGNDEAAGITDQQDHPEVESQPTTDESVGQSTSKDQANKSTAKEQSKQAKIKEPKTTPKTNPADRDYTIGLSQVAFDENDQVQVVSGPLKGMEGKVKKINLHKRYAEVEVSFMGRKTIFHMGIELLDKA